MHSVAEIVIPPNRDVKQSVTEIMNYFCREKYDDEGNELGQEDHADWWDFFVIGGRYSGNKLIATLDPKRLESFHQKLRDLKVTVSSMVCGKEDLNPPSQIPMVDELWREFFPGKGTTCPLFNHGRSQYGKDGIYADDLCKVSEVPDRLECERLIISWECKDKLRPLHMLLSEFWNGCDWQKTDFDGNVKNGIKKLVDKRNERDPSKPMDINDWIVVTVDYHN